MRVRAKDSREKRAYEVKRRAASRGLMSPLYEIKHVKRRADIMQFYPPCIRFRHDAKVSGGGGNQSKLLADIMSLDREETFGGGVVQPCP